MPANAQVFTKFLFEIVSFDLIDSSFAFDTSDSAWFTLSPSQGLGNNFDELGYESALILLNLGTLALMLILIPILSLIIIVVSYCTKNSKKVRRYWHQKVKNPFFFNAIIGFLEESFLMIAVSMLINQKQAFLGLAPKDFNFWFSCLISPFLALTPVLICYFYLKNEHLWKRVVFRQKYGIILDNLDLKNAKK